MSDMVPEVLNAALDSLFTPKEPGEQEYQGGDGLLYCRNCHTPVQCRVKLWGRNKIVPCLCRCQQEAMAEKKRQDELVERQRKIRQLKATGIQEKHLLEWNFAVAEDNKDIQHRYGSYENVLLSDTEYGKLRQEFPGDYQMRVERLSEYMASTGRSYKNHLATIRSWAKREKPKYNPADYTFEEGDSL